jgi:hypothetical protein
MSETHACGAQRFHSHASFDHTARALWLGTPLALDRRMLEAEDARLLAFPPPSKNPYLPS